jgi:hypothetical protein
MLIPPVWPDRHLGEVGQSLRVADQRRQREDLHYNLGPMLENFFLSVIYGFSY